MEVVGFVLVRIGGMAGGRMILDSGSRDVCGTAFEVK
jgi:hypothetical protein